jgi:dTDP-4-dehydrorhamnose reductase
MRLLVTGAGGQLGGYLLHELQESSHSVVAWSHTDRPSLFGVTLRPVDLTEPELVSTAFAHAHPDVVIHTAGVTSVAACYADPSLAHRVNTAASQHLADLCRRSGARLLFTSTDLVFDGEDGPYREENVPAPLSVYGRSKQEAEHAVLACPGGVVARMSLMFGPSLVGRPSFFDQQVTALRHRTPITLFADEWRTPLSLQTAAIGLLALAQSNFTGLIHMGGPQRQCRWEMGRQLADFLGVTGPEIIAANRADVPAPEPRPRDVSLDSSLWRSLFAHIPLPTGTIALEQLFRICR